VTKRTTVHATRHAGLKTADWVDESCNYWMRMIGLAFGIVFLQETDTAQRVGLHKLHDYCIKVIRVTF
jgi:hypothetical protein